MILQLFLFLWYNWPEWQGGPIFELQLAIWKEYEIALKGLVNFGGDFMKFSAIVIWLAWLTRGPIFELQLPILKDMKLHFEGLSGDFLFVDWLGGDYLKIEIF